MHIFLAFLLLAGCSDPEGDSTPAELPSLDGTVSISQTFFGESCELTRTFHATKRASYPWTCPACEGIYDVSYDLDDDVGDCSAEHYVTWSFDGGGDLLFLGREGMRYVSAKTSITTVSRADFDLFDEGSVFTDERVEATSTYASDGEEQVLTLNVDRGLDEGTIPAPEAAATSYACGWESSGAPAYSGPYRSSYNATFPDGLLRDSCGDLVRMHDLMGKFLLIEWGALDCGPCERFADVAPGMLDELRAEGIEVEFMSVYDTRSLFGTEASNADVQAFAASFELNYPMFHDELGWMSALTFRSGFDGVIPVFFLLRPDGTLFYQASGVEQGTWGTELGDVIRSEAAKP